MRLRITGQPRGIVDGIDLSRFSQGLTYDVATAVANLLLAEGWATPLSEGERNAPALVFPLISQPRQPRVLIVEDDDEARRFLANSLRNEGYAVVEARDGREGLAALKKHRPAVVLLDLRMPRMDGRQFRRAQQQLAERALADVPVVVVSAVDDAREQAEQIGAAEMLPKPIDVERLLATVSRSVRSTLPAV